MTIRCFLFAALAMGLCAVPDARADCGADFVAISFARGDRGFFYMNDACKEMVAGSRFCTLQEVVQSTSTSVLVPDSVNGGGSVRPEDLPGAWWVWDETVSSNTACAGWQGGPSGTPADYPEYGGLLMSASGNVHTDFCNQTNFVACCRPRCCCRRRLSLIRPPLQTR